MVTDTMQKEDIYAFCDELQEAGRGFIQTTALDLKLVENMARVSGRPGIYTAVAVNTDQHGKFTEGHEYMLNWMKEANEKKGLRIYGQAVTQDLDLTFTFENWNMFDDSPHWRKVTLGSPQERAAKMRDPENRKALIAEFDQGKGPIGSQFSTSGAAGDMLIMVRAKKESLRQYENMFLKEIAEKRGQHIVECLLDVSLEDELKTEWKSGDRSLDKLTVEVSKVANGEFCLPGVSDGGAHTKFQTLGEYTTNFLTNIVRRHEMMSLEDAHWRLSRYQALASGML